MTLSLTIDVDTLIANLVGVKEWLCSEYQFEHARVVADAVIAIKRLKNRPLSDEERHELDRTKTLQAHKDALDAVYNYFKEQLDEGNLLDPVIVANDLASTIKDFV